MDLAKVLVPLVTVLGAILALKLAGVLEGGKPMPSPPLHPQGVVNSSVPQLLSPTNEGVISQGRQTFTWSPIEGTTRYKFVLARDLDFTFVLMEAETPYASIEYPDGLPPGGGKYFWRVRAMAPVPSEWSTTWAFYAAFTSQPAPSAKQVARCNDPTNDLFDMSGRPAAGEPYLDIVSSELMFFPDGYYLARLTMNGSLPTQTPEGCVFIEWDIVADIDNSSKTGWHWPLMWNDIGPDYMVRLELAYSTYRGRALDISTMKWTDIQYKIQENVVELRLPVTSSIPQTFNYIVAVRKFGMTGKADDHRLADKAPNNGHYTLHSTY